MEFLGVLRAIVGFVLVLFIPGYLFIWALFPNKKEIGWIERVAFSMALSIALTTIPVMALNYVGMPLTEWTVFATVTAVTALCGLLALVRTQKLI